MVSVIGDVRDLDSVTQWLNKELHASSLERQMKKGRVVLRRLNCTEYENSLHDLLDIHVPLKKLLPEDNTAAGRSITNARNPRPIKPSASARTRRTAGTCSTIQKNTPPSRRTDQGVNGNGAW